MAAADATKSKRCLRTTGKPYIRAWVASWVGEEVEEDKTEEEHW